MFGTTEILVVLLEGSGLHAVVCRVGILFEPISAKSYGCGVYLVNEKDVITTVAIRERLVATARA